MNLDIIINKHLLIWHILYQSSVSMEVHKLKQKLWMDNKKEYTLVHKDKEIILRELDDFIPDDDTIYNMVETSLIFPSELYPARYFSPLESSPLPLKPILIDLEVLL